MGNWILIDYFGPMDWDQQTFPETLIQSEEHLRELLLQIRLREPSVVSLLAPAGDESLCIGIGDDLCGIYWIMEPRDRNFKAPKVDPPLTDRWRSFRFQVDEAVFQPEELLPTTKAIDIIAEFYRSRTLSTDIEWRSKH